MKGRGSHYFNLKSISSPWHNLDTKEKGGGQKQAEGKEREHLGGGLGGLTAERRIGSEVK